MTHVEALGLADLTEDHQLPVGANMCRLYTGTGGGVRWVGWSTNLQSSWGISTEFKQRLGAWLADVWTPSENAMKPELTVDGHLPQGLRLQGKAELIEVLRAWLDDSYAATVGDSGSFGGKPWIWVDVEGWTVALNADTKRSAVEAVVCDLRRDPNHPWRVVAARRSRINKVVPSPDGEPLPGWYAYLTDPLDAEATI